MKTREIAKFLFTLFSIYANLSVAAVDNESAGHQSGDDASVRAARKFSKGSVGLSGLVKRVKDADGNSALALVPRSGDRFYLELGSDSELKSRLEGFVTEDGQRDPAKIHVVDLVGEIQRKGEAQALKRVSIEFPDSEDEIPASRRALNGSFNINLKSPGIFTDQLATFLTYLREVVPDVGIGITVDNGQPYSGRRYLAVQINSDFSRTYLNQLISQSRELKAVVSSVEKTPARAIHLGPTLAHP